MAGEKLAEIFREITSDIPKSNFLFGKVTKASPLEVEIDDLPTIKGDMIFAVVDKTLSVGDKVFIVRSNDGQKFYIAERVV